jgi:putative CocE/NonD family hydrolase
VNEAHRSPHSAWETPDPGFWTRNGYAVLRADELGLGQSPGILDTMSAQTSLAFFDVIEWAASQPWSTGKVGLLGVSYYAGSQWRVAALRPKGLACIIPWEGMSDYYRDRCRHGGILSNTFIDFWWNRQVSQAAEKRPRKNRECAYESIQVITNQYGRPGRAARNWGPDTIEGDLELEELRANCRDQTVDNARARFLDDEYYASKEYDLRDIEVPLLSVGNWGGILLHLRGNIEGYLNAGSKLKYLRLITGRHDLPFYSEDGVRLQKSFLDAFLKGIDSVGWSTGKAPRVELVLRKGDVGYNDPEAEKAYPRRAEIDWPIPDMKYTKFYLTTNQAWTKDAVAELKSSTHISYNALGNLKNQQLVHFTTDAFTEETEFTGHIMAHLNVCASKNHLSSQSGPRDIDIFITIRHLDATGKEIFYTGTVGDPVPVTKGWLRVSLRKVNENSPRNKPWYPHRKYLSMDEDLIVPERVYTVDVEVWPTNVVVQRGEKLVLEVSSGDTQGAGLFEHNLPEDRPEGKFQGTNSIVFGPGLENWVLLPVIPPRLA